MAEDDFPKHRTDAWKPTEIWVTWLILKYKLSKYTKSKTYCADSLINSCAAQLHDYITLVYKNGNDVPYRMLQLPEGNMGSAGSVQPSKPPALESLLAIYRNFLPLSGGMNTCNSFVQDSTDDGITSMQMLSSLSIA